MTCLCSTCRRCKRDISPGPLLPAERIPDPGSPASRTTRRRSDAAGTRFSDTLVLNGGLTELEEGTAAKWSAMTTSPNFSSNCRRFLGSSQLLNPRLYLLYRIKDGTIEDFNIASPSEVGFRVARGALRDFVLGSDLIQFEPSVARPHFWSVTVVHGDLDRCRWPRMAIWHTTNPWDFVRYDSTQGSISPNR
jgi:hypothetical protein